MTFPASSRVFVTDPGSPATSGQNVDGSPLRVGLLVARTPPESGSSRPILPRTISSRASRGGHSLPGSPRDARDATRTGGAARSTSSHTAQPPLSVHESEPLPASRSPPSSTHFTSARRTPSQRLEMRSSARPATATLAIWSSVRVWGSSAARCSWPRRTSQRRAAASKRRSPARARRTRSSRAQWRLTGPLRDISRAAREAASRSRRWTAALKRPRASNGWPRTYVRIKRKSIQPRLTRAR